MSSHRLVPLLILAANCGGGGTEPAPPPPPPPPPTPASVSVNAGDGQQAAPGTPVATAPSVIVRAANGTAVPNVTVAFSVDSGGGSVASASAVTNASGIASPGAWTVGAAEGPQVLLASVNGIAPVKIRATSRIPTTEIATGTITTGGGNIRVERPGQPLDGLVLVIPPGAVDVAAQVTLSVVSTATTVFREGITAASAGLLISAASGTLKKPVGVRFPVDGPPDPNRVLLAYNQRTGESVVLPYQFAQGPTISAALPALDASIIPLPEGAAPSSGFLRSLTGRDEEDPIMLVVARIPPMALENEYESGFEVRRDNWDFTNFPVAWLPFLIPPEDVGLYRDEVVDIASGMVATSLWHFKRQRGGQPLYKRFRIQADQPMSNRVGIRWAALSNEFTPAEYVIPLKLLNPEGPKPTPQAFQYAQYALLKQTLYNGDDRPMPILLYEEADPLPEDESENEELEPEMALVIRTRPGEIHVWIPSDDGTHYVIKVSKENGVTPLRITRLDGSQFTIRSFFGVLERPLLDRKGVAANWPKVLDGTVGDAEGWPRPELHWREGKLDTARVFLAEPLTQFWECPSCPDYGVPLTGMPPEAKKPVPFNYEKIVNGVMPPLPDREVRGWFRWSADSVASDVDPTRTGHMIVLLQSATDIKDRFAGGWLDWQTVTYRKASLKPDPAAIEFSKDTTVSWTLDPSQPLPAGTTYSWVLRTSAGRDSVATATPTHTRNLQAGTEGTLLIIAHEKDSKRPIARDSVEIKAAEAAPFWRLTSIADSDGLLELGTPGQSGPLFDLLTRVVAAPGAGVIAVHGTLPTAELMLRVLPSTTWTADNCCPAGALFGELRQLLGVMPAQATGVGPYFAGWEQSRWSQTTTDLNSGSISGQYVMGTMSYDIPNVGIQIGPQGAIRISATRNGKVLTGNITFTIWWTDDETGELDEEEAFVFPFTAERIR